MEVSEYAQRQLLELIGKAKADATRDGAVDQWIAECPDCGGELWVLAQGGEIAKLTTSGFEADTGDVPMENIPVQCNGCDQILPLDYFFIEGGEDALARDISGRGTVGDLGSKIVEIKMTATFEVPQGSTILRTGAGYTSGIRLPNGEVIKPWIAFELYRDSDGNEVCEDLNDDHLQARGVITHLDLNRQIEGEVETEEESP